MTRVLFVCTGNTCRSPMAEAILRNRGIQGVEVKSAGVFAAPGSEASVNTIKVLEEEGISIEHQSSPLTESLVNWSTYIFTMTASHKASVLSAFPSANGKTYTLKEFAGENAAVDIMDPYGGPVEIYRHTYNEMKEKIEKIISDLNKKN